MSARETPSVPPPEILDYPGLLDLPRARLRGYRPETSITDRSPASRWPISASCPTFLFRAAAATLAAGRGQPETVRARRLAGSWSSTRGDNASSIIRTSTVSCPRADCRPGRSAVDPRTPDLLSPREGAAPGLSRETRRRPPSRRLRKGRLCVSGGAYRRSPPESAFRAWLRSLHRQPWVVYAKPPFGSPAHVLHYLARYTHRVAISNHRLVAVTDDTVSFRWKEMLRSHPLLRPVGALGAAPRISRRVARRPPRPRTSCRHPPATS